METSPASSFAKCVEQVFPSRFQAREGRRQFQAEASFTSQWLQKVEQQLRIHRDLFGRQLQCEEFIGEILRDPAPHCLRRGMRREKVAPEYHAAQGVDYQQHMREVWTIPLILDSRGEHEAVYLQAHFPSRQPSESLDLGHLHLV